MAVPDYQSLMLPLLKIAGDENEHSINEAIDKKLSNRQPNTSRNLRDKLSSLRQTLATTSNFSQQAQNYANGIENLKIILIDGEQLAQLMIDHDIGVTEESRYIVKKVDLDYFDEE